MEFNIQRLWFLLKKDLRLLVVPTFLITSVIYFVISSINLLTLIGAHGPQNLDLFKNFLIFAYICAAIIGAISFEEIKKRNTRVEYLTLPASAFEKLSSKFISTMIIYPLLIVILYIIGANLINGVANLIYPDDIIFRPNPDHKWTLYTIGAIITSFFAYGSIKFNTGSFIKIILWLIAFALIFAFINFLFSIAMFPEFRNELFGMGQAQNNMHMEANPADHWVISFTKKAFYALPLLFWVMSYFTLKEKEA